MQEIRRLKPSTVSRRTSVVAGFYRTAVIDGLLEHSPADHVRRPRVPTDSPTLGLTHLQLEALLTAARQSPTRNDFALVCLLGLLGLRIFEATGTNITDLGEEHGHRVLRVAGKGDNTVLIPLPPAVGRALDQAIGDRTAGPILLNRRGARMDRHAATRRLRALAAVTGMRMPPLHPHMLTLGSDNGSHTSAQPARPGTGAHDPANATDPATSVSSSVPATWCTWSGRRMSVTRSKWRSPGDQSRAGPVAPDAVS